MKSVVIISISLLLAASPLYAQQIKPSKEKVKQSQRTQNRNGNAHYKKGAYADAEACYRKALSNDSSYYRSLYNLGNSLYKQKNYGEAAKQFEAVASNAKVSNSERCKAYHNLGNSQLQQGLQQRQNGAEDGGRGAFQKAVNAYQEALKLDPKNQDTKYNLSYAKKMLYQAQQQQQNQQNQKNQPDQQQQQKNQQQQNQNSQDKPSDKNNDQNKQNQDNQNQDQGGQDQQNQDQKSDQKNKGKQPQPRDQQQKEQQKKQAEQILKAVKNNEQKTLKDQQKQQESKVDGRITQDW